MTRPTTLAGLVLLAACQPREDPSAAPGRPDAARPPASRATLDLGAAKGGALPAGWTAAETGGRGKPATWRVEEDAGATGGGRVLRLVESSNSGETFNLVMSEATFPADLDLSVEIRADSGREDRGGGLLWRARDAGHYQVARWNPLEKNLRVYHVLGGERSMLGSVDLDADPARWHSLRVRAGGRAFEVLFDGESLLRGTDEALSSAGKVGVWTKADAASSFRELAVAAER
jgi:hypothetical protein